MAGSSHRLWPMILAFLTMTYFLESSTSGQELEKSTHLAELQFDYPVGDPRRCVQQARQTHMDMIRLGVLPGNGWDNLQNLDMGEVVRFNYSKCKLTDDGRYLIPDNVIALPVKSSHVETFAEMIDTYLRTTSSTSYSINVQSSLKLSFMSVSGSYSQDHQLIKSKQIEDNSVTTRVQLRYQRYKALLEPDPELNPKFKSRMLDIAGNLILNNTEIAFYLGQMLVRDYGTHYQTSVTAGASLEKLDFLKRSSVSTDQTEKTNILAQASASFFDVFSISPKYKQSSTTTVSTKYKQSVTHSFVNSRGGLSLGANTSLDTWVKAVDTNMVPMDRSGDPLSFLVTSKLFPELEPPALSQLREVVRQSIETYYQMNTIEGCTKLSSSNFNPTANFDDGTCKAANTNFTLGGVYQTCQVTSGRYLTHNPCTNMQQVNPRTGGYSCPQGYQPVQIFSGHRTSPTESERHCGGWWVFRKCSTHQYQATATYKAFWCAATGPVSQYSGYMFGGVYTSHYENPVTGEKKCPEKFYGLRLLTDMVVCLSDEYEWAAGVPFGGFFSCSAGNPLSQSNQLPKTLQDRMLSHEGGLFLRDFMSSDGRKGVEQWPMKCGEGYSRHMPTVEQGCAIHYCVKSGALSGPTLPPIKRPPFSVAPPALIENEDNMMLFDLDTQTWYRDEAALEMLSHDNPRAAFKDLSHSPSQAGGSGSDHNMAPGTAAGIAVGATLALIALVAIAIILVARGRRRSSSSREINEERSLFGSMSATSRPGPAVAHA